jgi:hypothetical protein
MVPTLIYLDTNIWNRLADQNIDPQKLLRDLVGKNGNLALSGQTIYELAKTFLSPGSNALVRAQNLFQYVKPYVDAEIPCAHDNMEQLHGEVDALNTGATEVIAFYGPEEYALLKAEIEKLSQGICDKRAEEFIAGRKHFSESTRSGQQNHLQAKQNTADRLKTVTEDKLRAWLDREMLSDIGAAILADHLLRMYKDLSSETAIMNAHALLQIPPSRIAKGIVRADLYFNWRCANRGSNPKDLVDDLYHVLNSSYCSFYATAEPKQAEYASLMLNQWTRVAVYDGQTPIDAWLLQVLN